MRRLLVTVAFLLVLAGLPLAGGASPDAAKPAPKLPPAPIKCQTPDGDGCYGWQYGPEYMDNTFIGEMTIAPHIVKVGQSVQITMDAFATADWTAQAGAPCGEIMRGATTGGAIDAKCTQKMTSPTHGWLRLPGTFCYLPPIACGTEQEALYVLGEDEYAISGIVRDAGGKGVKNVRIDISPGYYAVTENINGFYQALLKKGKYTVTAPAGYCVKGVRPCTRSKVVNLTGATAVDFQENDTCEVLTGATGEPAKCHRVFGSVLDEAGKPANGVVITLSSGRKKLVKRSGQDGPGAFSFKVKDGAYTIAAKGRYCLLPWKEDPKRCSSSGGVTLDGADRRVNFQVEAYTISVYTWGANHATPRPGVKLRLSFVGSKKAYLVTTDTKGKKSIRLPRGAYRVRSLTKEYCHAPDLLKLKSCDRATVFSVIKPAPLEYRAELYELSGVVESKNGKPQADVDVRVRGKSLNYDHLVRTAADGSYALSVRPGRYTVSAKHPRGFVVCAVRGGKANPCKPEASVDVGKPVDQDFEVRLRSALKVALKALSGDGWSVLAGKTFDRNRRGFRVGFQSRGSPAGSEVDFTWTCHSGCVNVLATVTDVHTGKAPEEDTLVRATLDYTGAVPYAGPAAGALCVDKGNQSGLVCGSTVEVTLKKGHSQVPFYYYVPGTTAPGTAHLRVTADNGEIRDDLGLAEQDVKVRPHPLFAGRILKMRLTDIETVNSLVYLGTYWKTGEIVGPIDGFCSAVAYAVEKATAWAARHGISIDVSGAVDALEAACAIGEAVVEKFTLLKQLIPFALWGTLMEGFDLPPAGLRGVPTAPNGLFAFVAGGGEVEEALFDGLATFLVAPGLKAPGLGDELSLRLAEVSHRLTSGNIVNGLVIEMLGQRSGKLTPRTTTYASTGYEPECWLDPSRNQDYSLLANPCNTPHP